MSAKIVVTDDKLHRLAIKIADEESMITFNSNCYWRDGWFAIPPASERDGYLNARLRYLRARKMLERNPEDASLWRAVKAPGEEA